MKLSILLVCLLGGLIVVDSCCCCDRPAPTPPPIPYCADIVDIGFYVNRPPCIQNKPFPSFGWLDRTHRQINVGMIDHSWQRQRGHSDRLLW